MASSTIKDANNLKLPPGDDLDIVLVGRSGNGKMSTGNTILGRKTFRDLGPKRKHQVGYRGIDGRVIKVVDSLGYCHKASCSHKEESAQAFSEALSKGLSEFPTGFSAMIFVLSFAKPITKREMGVIKALKEILGDDVMKKNGIVLFTHGDVLNAKLASDKNKRSDKSDDDSDDCEHENKETVKKSTNIDNEVFQNWCKDQKGLIRDILKECDFRCVAFNNTSEDALEKKTQLFNLVSQLDKIKTRNTKFTLANFMNKDKEKDENDPEGHSEDERVLPMILQAINKEMNLIEDMIAVYKCPQSSLEQHQHDYLLGPSQDEIHEKRYDDANKSKSDDNDDKALGNDDEKPYDNNGHKETDTEKQNSDLIEHEDCYLDIVKIKEKTADLLHEIEHHEPEKLEVLKTDLEGIYNLMEKLLRQGKHEHSHELNDEQDQRSYHDHEHDIEEDHVHTHKSAHDHEHDHDQRHNHNRTNNCDDDLGHKHEQEVHSHDHKDNSKSKRPMKGLFKRGEIGDEHLSLILQRTDSVQEKLQEIKEQESWYHSWINTEIISPARDMMDTIFPSLVEGLLEMADFISDILLDD